MPRLSLVALLLLPLTTVCAGEFEAAVEHFKARRYPEAHAAFSAVAAAEPKNAAVRHYLGRVCARRNDAAALEEAAKWFGEAAELEPANATYLAAYGGALLNAANRSRSLSSANKGRDMLEKAVALDPAQLDAREALFRFYHHAPWPIGSGAKARAHLAELRKHDPERATVLSIISRVDDKDYAGAFKVCDELIAAQPDHYTALYQYGRTASISGQNLERGLARLRQCVALTPPSPASPPHSAVWHRIGNIEEKLQRPAEARTAYETALRLDPGNRQAKDAVARLK
ncbi:MAG: tetratricopeptide repeat protein [Opitutaceae bacterium]|nr:tetratricopeptide repeat protein [Opitutaceae bacterium]